MKKNLKFLALGLTVVVLAAAFFAGIPARAEEDAGVRTFVSDVRGSSSWKWFYYPTSRSYFVLPDRYETRFDTSNGVWFEVFYREVYPGPQQARNFTGDFPYSTVKTRINVSFYSPTGEFIGKYDNIQPNRFISVPHNSRSLEYDRLQVKIENFSRFNRELRFLMVSPHDAVRGTPIPGVFREP